MSQASLSRVLPLKSADLWKGVGLGVAALTLLFLAVLVPNLVRPRMALRSFVDTDSRRSGGGGGAALPLMVSQGLGDVVHADGPKIIRKAQLHLLVANCAEALKKIEVFAATESGFVESSTLEENSAKITLRVPSARLDVVRGKLKDIAVRVEEDSVAASDVSKQYVDRDSRLRNLRAEEQQFLDIMKKSHTVPDVLAVTKELAQVRSEIEQAETDFRHLKEQIDMAEIDVTLAAEPSRGPGWTLGSSIKSAVKALGSSLTALADFLIWLLVNLPLLALWALTVFFLAAGGWYVLRKAARAMRAMYGNKPTAQAPPA
jgi:hypothetical protein